MKRLVSILMAIALLCSMLVFAEDTTPIASYQAEFAASQGINNFYFCESIGGQVKELQYGNTIENRPGWVKAAGEYPQVHDVFATPSGAADYEIKFVSPKRGTVRLQGTVNRVASVIGGSEYGDGVKLSILKNSRELWSGSLATNQASVSYDVTASLKIGDELHFRVNCGQSSYYDRTIWWPKVEFTSTNYVTDEFDPTYWQKDVNGTMTELTYNEATDGYAAADGKAFVSDSRVLPSNQYSLVKRFKLAEEGRYRIYAPVIFSNEAGLGNVAKVYKNGNEIWRQLLVSGETSIVDIGVYVQKNDVIDVEVGVKDFEGFNSCTWSCDAIKYLGILFKECSTSQGTSYSAGTEYTLSSLIQNGGSDVGIYTEKYVKEPMTYNKTNQRYESAVEGETDYVSTTIVKPGTTTDAVVDVTVPKDGVVKLSGDLRLTGANTDGVLAKIYLNQRLLWSSRVGGEQSLRWDDPFDEVYFLNTINTMAKVKTGDVLSFTFNKWRGPSGDTVDISDVKISYITGNILSETTQWKLAQSTVIDTDTNILYQGGTQSQVTVRVSDGITYIAKEDVEKIFGAKAADVLAAFGTNSEMRIREAAEAAGMSVSWTADRMVILYDGVAVRFGYPESGEIKTQLEQGGDLFA